MSGNPLVILVTESSANAQVARGALEGGDQPFTVQQIERVRTAVARLAGGGVSAVVLDLSADGSADQGSEAVRALHAAAPEVPLILLCGDESPAELTVKEGALGYLRRPDWQRDLKRTVLDAVAAPQVVPSGRAHTERRKGSVVAVVGAKGGVGATTVAVNVASVLASTSKVTLAELRPPFGTLCHFFRPHRSARSLQNLLAIDVADINPGEVESCLWPNRNIPGLNVLFAPERVASIEEMGSDHVSEILARLAELSEVVVVDLPPSLFDTERAVLAKSDTLAMVLERDALSLDAAKAMLSALEGFGIVPQEAGVVVVNRVPLAAPLALAEIESQLGLPIFAVIPPAADLCVSAYRVHMPVVKLDAQSSMATSLVNLAKRLSRAAA